jgi:iron(III) transport system ATP-binding protein
MPARGTAGAAIPAQLSFEGVGHHYGRVEALNAIDLAVAPGEIVALLGQSGCGKSTLLRIAAGIERQTAGRVFLDGRCVAGPDTFDPPESRGVGLVFQDYALFPHLSVLDNVVFGLRALKRADARQIGLAALRRVGLENHAGDYPHHLSGGEQQRAALARAIAPRPGVMLMDEPFSGLDRRLRDRVRGETIEVLRESGSTCVIVTHDPEEAMHMADRIALMHAGRLVQIGTPDDLYRRPANLFAARFFSDINELPAMVSGAAAETPLGQVDAGGLPPGPAVVAVRPAAVRLGPPGQGVPGRIIARRFLGEIDHVEIATEGLDRPLTARLRAGGNTLNDEVGVAFDPAEALVFPGTGP